MITGNKGEWSELYVLLKLLADGKLHAADADLRKLSNIYSPLLRVFRKEIEAEEIEYRLGSSQHKVELYVNGDRIKSIQRDWLKNAAQKLYDGIVAGGDTGAFTIHDSDSIMSEMHCTKIKAKTENKADIVIQIHDASTGHNNICGFSIKSDLGAPPTLFNASKHTNFVYEVIGLSNQDADTINNIAAKNKIIARMLEIGKRGGVLCYKSMDSKVFYDNIMFIDSMMDRIIGDLLMRHYVNNISDVTDAVTLLENDNPLGFNRKGVYRHKVKKFLCASALGMVPSKKWDGRDEANGGYIIVRKDGDVVAYHLYNRDSFETYLLNNTKFEHASTSRNEYAKIFKEDNKMYIKLNLQIRFK